MRGFPVHFQRYCDWLRRDWRALTGDEKTAICDHLLNNDLSETRSVLESQARAAGLDDAVELALPPNSGPRYFKGVSEADLLAKANRALMWGPMPDGSIIFQEGPVVIAKQEAS